MSLLRQQINLDLFPHWWEIWLYQKTTKNSIKAFERFERFLLTLLHLCRSRFHMIILGEKFRCKFQEIDIKKNYFERNKAFKWDMEECKSFHDKVLNIKYCWNTRVRNVWKLLSNFEGFFYIYMSLHSRKIVL